MLETTVLLGSFGSITHCCDLKRECASYVICFSFFRPPLVSVLQSTGDVFWIVKRRFVCPNCFASNEDVAMGWMAEWLSQVKHYAKQTLIVPRNA